VALYDNDDEQEEPAFDPDEAGPSQPVQRRMINPARLQGREMEQMDAIIDRKQLVSTSSQLIWQIIRRG